jgi:hypothetical protein
MRDAFFPHLRGEVQAGAMAFFYDMLLTAIPMVIGKLAVTVMHL